jgi:hypothetical protein
MSDGEPRTLYARLNGDAQPRESGYIKADGALVSIE